MNESFTYVNIEKLKEVLHYSRESINNHRVFIGNYSKELHEVKERYRDIKWLEACLNENSKIVFQNSYNDRELRGFVLTEFDINKVLEEVYTKISDELNEKEDYMSNNLMQLLYRTANDVIGEANLDLQQVSYCLTFNLVGHIHLFVVYVIWKKFEELNWKRKCKPLDSMKLEHDRQLKYFLAMISEDDSEKNKVASNSVKDKFKALIDNQLDALKGRILEELIQNFKQKYTRKEVQDKIDARFFSINQIANNNELYQYMISPEIVLEQEYQDLYEEFAILANQELSKSTTIIKDIVTLKDKIISLNNILKNYKEEKCASKDIFEFTKNKAQQGEVLVKFFDQKLGKSHFSFIIHLILGEKKLEDLHFTLDKDNSVKLASNMLNIPTTPINNINIKALLNDLIKMENIATNTILFLKFFENDISDLSQSISQNLKYSINDLKKLKENINKYICKQKCPCCDRICGHDDLHKFHECLYGHQIRGISGVKLNNGEASVLRCEDIADNDILQFNGKESTWLEFKQNQEKLLNNPWKFEDTSFNRDKKQQDKFILAWELIGQRICNEKGMNYVKFNQITVEEQQKKLNVNVKHY